MDISNNIAFQLSVGNIDTSNVRTSTSIDIPIEFKYLYHYLRVPPVSLNNNELTFSQELNGCLIEVAYTVSTKLNVHYTDGLRDDMYYHIYMQYLDASSAWVDWDDSIEHRYIQKALRNSSGHSVYVGFVDSDDAGTDYAFGGTHASSFLYRVPDNGRDNKIRFRIKYHQINDTWAGYIDLSVAGRSFCDIIVIEKP